ncbi:hypothetical protein [Paenibacillus odorifer]|uniref:hypothetical protein n=1 Tax=Paenibacillus odorifer TaxID=189426 RepID=UPI00096BD842|nr:hypothetical protein [Paenibacillus odorifer]OMD76867.1 hypothetical protein BSK50_14030 [Paenibacillus odorifer]
MKKMRWLLLVIMLPLLSGCNGIAKNFGGTTTIDLPQNKKLVNITWKDSDLWYLTRDIKPEEKAETYTFKEESNYGVKSGTVIINEH